ncbi:MAG: GNAT family N-acetyltransferase [Bdellovibrionales bacterium]|nr:GNAT family N-acetyltransferase [Bdellovibrionales bacterium]
MRMPPFFFNDELKEVPRNDQEYLDYVDQLKESLRSQDMPKTRLLIYENLGVALRILNRLDEAEEYLSKALSLSSLEPPSKQIQNLIRLAHVYQWQEQFIKAKCLFDQVRELLNEFSTSDTLKAAYHQHLGKLYFDQKLFGLAITEFELAKKLRVQNLVSKDQIESTAQALIKAKENWAIDIPIGFVIRRAQVADAQDIHQAHMTSINKICSRDHTADEIRVWGGRNFEQVNRTPAIQSEFYLVVEYNGKIEGFCQAKAVFKGKKEQVHLYGFYITPKILKMGVGHIFMNLVIEYSKFEKISLITLKSTLTAFNFYKKYGFVQTGELTGPIRDGVMIRGYPMEKVL